MIITKKYAKHLIRYGKAIVLGKTTDQPIWDERHNGKTFVILNRLDQGRTDHYIED